MLSGIDQSEMSLGFWFIAAGVGMWLSTRTTLFRRWLLESTSAAVMVAALTCTVSASYDQRGSRLVQRDEDREDASLM